METYQFILKKLFYAIPLVFGVTLISFILMVYFGPDKTYTMLGKNPSEAQIREVRHQLGYDQPFLKRYIGFMKEVVTLNFGNSDSTGEKVESLFLRTVPVSIMISVPILLFGTFLSVMIALIAANFRSGIIDRTIMAFSAIGMSISFLIIIITFQVVFCSSFGLNLFPVQGWSTSTLSEYLFYATVPVSAGVFVSLGYSTRFYRAIFVEELTRDHVRTARAFGINPWKVLYKCVLKNSLIPIVTRVIASLPFIVIGGSLLLETYFSIPGIGQVIYNATSTGDLPVIKAAVTYTALLYVISLSLTDIIYKIVDPRVALK